MLPLEMSQFEPPLLEADLQRKLSTGFEPPLVFNLNQLDNSANQSATDKVSNKPDLSDVQPLPAVNSDLMKFSAHNQQSPPINSGTAGWALSEQKLVIFSLNETITIFLAAHVEKHA